MQLGTYISLLNCGGVGSGCHGDNCGRPSTGEKWHTSTGEAMYPVKSTTEGKAALAAPHIKALRVPPAWTDVSVNPDPSGKLMVTGKDAKGRVQSLYSPAYVQTQSDLKFARIFSLEQKLPSIQKKNAANLSSSDPKTKESAELLSLIMQTGIRPGGEGDTGADKKAYGATTLLGRHVVVGSNGSVRLKFVGKKGVDLSIPVPDKALAASLAARAEKAGRKEQIFPNVDAGDLLHYVKEVTGDPHIKTKDFRTLLANRLATAEVSKTKAPSDPKTFKKSVRAVATAVAKVLGNTATVALASYIHPKVFTGGWKGGGNYVTAVRRPKLDPHDLSTPILPMFHYGVVGGKPIPGKVDEDTDENGPTAQWVIDELGFDPKKK